MPHHAKSTIENHVLETDARDILPDLRAELTRIVERSSTVSERLGHPFVLADEHVESGTVRERLTRWRRTAAKGDPEVFARRLVADEWSEDLVARALGSAKWPATEPLPAWAGTLGAVLETVAVWCDDVENLGGPDHEPDGLPFHELLVPFLALARRRLAGAMEAASGVLAPEGQALLEEHFLAHLCQLSMRTFDLEFSLFRSRGESSLARFADSSSSPPRELYRSFVADMYAGGLRRLFQEYAVLARLLATQTDAWVSRIAEFLTRLTADRARLASEFGSRGDFGRLIDVSPFLSDLHEGGRSVIRLEFDSGVKLIYKPRPVELEKAWFLLLAWMNEHRAPLPWKTLRVVSGEGYGWVEYVAPAPCNDRGDVERYYRRAGMLVALTYALQGTDFHYENVIAHGEHPVLIDLETILYPRLKTRLEDEAVDAEVRASDELMRSVLASGLLPGWEQEPGGNLYDAGGFSHGLGDQVAEMFQWVNVNTDRMKLASMRTTPEPARNLPRLGDEAISPTDFEPALVEGFRDMYRYLLAQRDALLHPDGPLSSFRDRRVRFIFRNTKLYARLLDGSLRPAALRDGVDRFIEFDSLSRGLLVSSPNPLWPILSEEIEALTRHDVPMFETRSTEGSLSLGGTRELLDAFEQDGYSRVTAHLDSLSEDDLEQQTEFVRVALFSRRSRLSGTRAAVAQTLHDRSQVVGLPPASDRVLLRGARRIAEDLQRRAIRGRDGSAAWIAPGYISAGSRSPIRLLESPLYDGCSGVGLFLGAWARVSGDEASRELALAAFAPLRARLASDGGRDLADRIGIGGANGLGSIVYGLVRASQLLEAPELLQSAGAAASQLDAERLGADRQLDVIGGAAGALLGLLALHETTGDIQALERAVQAGCRLLEAATPSQAGPRAWRTLNGNHHSGFSHGAAGIAHALLRLFRVTGESRFLDAALEGIAFERTLFRTSEANWEIKERSGPSSSGDAFAATWCHGAPGIGLARVGGLDALDPVDGHETRREIHLAVETTFRVGREGLDHLCCGNFGRIETVWEAGRRLERPDWREAARRQAIWLVRRAEARGGFETLEDLPRGTSIPTFFQGTAGIGYQLLRLVSPESIPSALLWS